MWLDIAISAALALLTIGMGYLGVHVTLHPAESPRARRWYKIGFSACAIGAVGFVVWQGVRNGNSQRTFTKRIGGLEENLAGTRQQVADARGEEKTESTRRQQAEKDLALFIQGIGKKTRDGVAEDIKKSPIKVELNGAQTEQAPLQVEGIRLFSEVERSTHPDAPFAVKVTLQADTPINPLRVAIHCASGIKYAEEGYGNAGYGMLWFGGVEPYKKDPTVVIVNMTGAGNAPLRPDLPMILHLAASESIRIQSFERGPR
jgi:hypothetical protein